MLKEQNKMQEAVENEYLKQNYTILEEFDMKKL